MDYLPTVSEGVMPGERALWNVLKDALRSDEGIAVLHYAVYPKRAPHRYEPDILLLHRRLGLVLIEVKDCRAENIESIRSHVWKMTNWRDDQEEPFRQVEEQGFAVGHMFDRFPSLKARLRRCTFVALPFVDEEEWEAKGFGDLSISNRMIFKNHVTPARLRRRLDELAGDSRSVLTDEEWALACQVLGLRQAFERPEVTLSPTGSAIVDRIRASEVAIPALDIEQLKIGLEIPPGPQRIRGIAGSGKTLLIAMKAARMHLSHPDWEIAVVFNTKSLYQTVEANIQRFCRLFGDCEPDWDRLRVLHGWGGKTSGPGLYSVLADRAGYTARSFEWAKAQRPNGSPGDLLAALCEDLLESATIKPAFDAVLIDEGQDFAPEVFRLAYEGLREPKRLIWAYDEAQSLDSLRIPNAETLFGRDDKGRLRVDLTGYYPGGIQKSRIMRKCYRTPAGILMPAHAFGMGLMRSAGPVQMITTQQGWQDIGYHVEGAFDAPGRQVTLTRGPENRPHPLDRDGDAEALLKCRSFVNRNAELDDCAARLADLARRGVSMDEVMVVFPGSYREQRAIEDDMEALAGKLLATHHLKAHLAERENDAKFRRPGAVTLSRIHRAKGNEAAFVFVVGLDRLAATEDQVESRNQLFVALTRARGLCRVSGVVPAAGALLAELEAILDAGDSIRFHTPDPNGTRVRDLNEAPDRPPVLPFVTHLPLYDLPAAAGRWPGTRVPDLDDTHWIDLSDRGDLNPQMFAVRVVGKSMEPRISDGAIAVFQATNGMPQDRIVLAGLADPGDPDGAAAWVVKRLVVQHHAHGGMEYRLRSENSDFEDIPIGPAEAERLRIQGVYKFALNSRS